MIGISPDITKAITIDNTLLVTAEELGTWINLSPSAITAITPLLESLIKSATEEIENFTWLNLRRKTFEAFYNMDVNSFLLFTSGHLKLHMQRSPILTVNDITKIEYLDNDQYVEFDRGTEAAEGLFDNATEKLENKGFASIYFENGIPFQNRFNTYQIKVTFDSGFDNTDPLTAIPESLKTAIKIIAAYLYTNRGDCAEVAGCNGCFTLPTAAMSILNQWTLQGTSLGSDYETNSMKGCSYGLL